MNCRSFRNSVSLIIIFTVSLAACRKTPVPSPTPSGESRETTPSPTTSPGPTVTSATTYTQAPSLTFTPTPTQAWDNPALAQTPLPALAGEIHSGNTGNIQPLAVWGDGRANVIRLAPNGQALAVGTDLGAVLYDSLTYIRLAFWTTPEPVLAIAFSLDNNWIALGQRNGTIDIINQASLTLSVKLIPVDPLSTAKQAIQTLAFSSDSERLFLAEQEAGVLQLSTWDTDTWQIIANETISVGEGIYISPELDLIGVIDSPILQFLSLTYPEERDQLDLPADLMPDLLEALASADSAIIPSTDGDFLLINTGDSLVRWTLLEDSFSFDLSDYPAIPDPCNQAPVTCLNNAGGFSWECPSKIIPPIGLVSLTPDNIMMLISRNDGQTEFRRSSDTLLQWVIDSSFTDVSFSPGGEFFFGLKPEGTIEKRSTLDGSLLDYIDQHPSELYDLAFSPDGSVLAAGFSDGWIRVYSTSNGQMLGVLTGSAHALAFTPDGSLLGAGLGDGTVRLFNLTAGDYDDLRPGHLAAVTDLAFSRNGDQFLTGSADCTASLWQVIDGQRIRSLTPDGNEPFRIERISLSADAEWLFFSGNRPGMTTIHGIGSGNQMLPSVGVLTDLALTEEDVFLAAAGAQVWLLTNPTSIQPGKSAPLPDGLMGPAAVLAFSPDRSLLAAASARRLVFWSTSDQMLLSSLTLPETILNGSQPVSLAFSPFGDLLALGTENGLIHIFGISSLPGE